MNKLIINNNRYIITCDIYEFEYDRQNPDFFFVKFDFFTQEFFIPSSCDSNVSLDLNHKQESFELIQKEDMFKLIFVYKSSLWQKIYYIDLYNTHIEYYYSIRGDNSIGYLHFFEGLFLSSHEEHYSTKHFNDKKKTQYEEYRTGSLVNFKKVFNPEPNVYDKQIFDFYEYSLISVNCDFIDYCGGNFQFTPGLLCFSISNSPDKEWVTLGLAINKQEYMFSDYEYSGGNYFGLKLNYGGISIVNDIFETPKVIILKSKSSYTALSNYVEVLKDKKLINFKIKKENIKWWNGPIISGFGHQSYQADLFRTRSPMERQPDFAAYFLCTQFNYESILSILKQKKLNWNILIIDVRWYINAGQKEIDIGRWPDMKSFVRKLHQAGKKVLIWWAPWKVEGWDIDECIIYHENNLGINQNRVGKYAKNGGFKNGIKIAPDITLESVQYKILKQLYNLFSSNGIDLDGIKIDHSAETPGYFGLHYPQGSRKLFGIELLKYYMDFLYENIKLIKNDALVIGQTANPYFADCQDMLRIGDTYSKEKKSIVKQMQFRVNMSKIANPFMLIDTDGWPMPSLEALDKYINFQIKNGVPSFYYATHIDTTGEIISEKVWEKLVFKWNEYLKINNLISE